MLQLASGQRLSDIANEMSVSSKTISTYRKRILDKMKLKSDPELATYARENRLVP